MVMAQIMRKLQTRELKTLKLHKIADASSFSKRKNENCALVLLSLQKPQTMRFLSRYLRVLFRNLLNYML
jgi:hypothetical protein